MKKVEVGGYGHLLQSSADYLRLEQLPADAMIGSDMFFSIIAHVNEGYPDGLLASDVEYKNFSLGQLNMLGALGQLVQVSPTLQNVSEAFYAYYGKLNGIFSPGVEHRGDYVASLIKAAERSLWQVRPFQVAVEMFLYGMIRIVKEWFDDDLGWPLAVSLPYEMPAVEKGVLRQLTGLQPVLGDACYLLFKSEVFLKPLPFANPQLWQHLRRYMDEQQSHSQPLVTARLSAFLRQHLTSPPGIAAAADHLSMSERSLQRHLAAEKSSYQQVLDKVREERAKALLGEHRLSLKEIALDCGFKDPNSFFKAFKKWTGQTPERWREDH